MWIQLMLMILSIILSFVLFKLKFTDACSVFLAFSPQILSLLYNNFEKIKLLCKKIEMRNKSISIKVLLKKNYKINSLEYDIDAIECRLKEKLIADNIKVGIENNKLRIEGNQCIKTATDNNLKIKVPLVLYFQFSDDQLICNLENSYPALVFSEIPQAINNLQKLWTIVDDYIKSSSNSQIQRTLYSANIKVNSDVFKNVYLAPYAPKYIKKLELKKENVNIELTNDVLKISSKSFSDFEKNILQYSGSFKGFFDKEGE